MSKKVLGVLSLMMLSSLSYANEDVSGFFKTCDFDVQERGTLVTFNEQSPKFNHFKKMYSQEKGIYNNWYEFTNNKTPIVKAEYIGRHAFISEEPVKTVNEDGRIVSYYAAISDNCQNIFMRVSHEDHPEYFNADSVLASMDFDFLKEEYNYGYIEVSNFERLEKGVLSNLYAKPNADVKFIDKYYQGVVTLPDFTKLSVIDAKIRPFTLNQQVISSYFIQVKYGDKEGFVAGNMGDFLLNNPSDFISERAMTAITEDKVIFGMSIGEIKLSRGEIVRSSEFNVYSTHNGYVVDYSNEIKDGTPVNKEVHVYFEGLEVPFIFNQALTLDKDLQRFNPNKSIIPLEFFMYQ